MGKCFSCITSNNVHPSDRNDVSNEREQGGQIRGVNVTDLQTSTGLNNPVNQVRGNQYVDVDSRVEEEVKLMSRMQLFSQLPIVNCTKEIAQDYVECSICMCFFEIDERLRYLPCMHVYHQTCVDEWFMRSFTCPSCIEPIEKLISNNDIHWQASQEVNTICNGSVNKINSFPTEAISEHLSEVESASLESNKKIHMVMSDSTISIPTEMMNFREKFLYSKRHSTTILDDSFPEASPKRINSIVKTISSFSLSNKEKSELLGKVNSPNTMKESSEQVHSFEKNDWTLEIKSSESELNNINKNKRGKTLHSNKHSSIEIASEPTENISSPGLNIRRSSSLVVVHPSPLYAAKESSVEGNIFNTPNMGSTHNYKGNRKLDAYILDQFPLPLKTLPPRSPWSKQDSRSKVVFTGRMKTINESNSLPLQGSPQLGIASPPPSGTSNDSLVGILPIGVEEIISPSVSVNCKNFKRSDPLTAISSKSKQSRSNISDSDNFINCCFSKSNSQELDLMRLKKDNFDHKFGPISSIKSEPVHQMSHLRPLMSPNEFTKRNTQSDPTRQKSKAPLFGIKVRQFASLSEEFSTLGSLPNFFLSPFEGVNTSHHNVNVEAVSEKVITKSNHILAKRQAHSLTTSRTKLPFTPVENPPINTPRVPKLSILNCHSSEMGSSLCQEKLKSQKIKRLDRGTSSLGNSRAPYPATIDKREPSDKRQTQSLINKRTPILSMFQPAFRMRKQLPKLPTSKVKSIQNRHSNTTVESTRTDTLDMLSDFNTISSDKLSSNLEKGKAQPSRVSPTSEDNVTFDNSSSHLAISEPLPKNAKPSPTSILASNGDLEQETGTRDVMSDPVKAKRGQIRR